MDSIIFKPRNAILILLLFSLGLYYHALNAEPLSGDDKGMLSNYNNNTLTIKGFFFDERTEHYYRPIVLSSFLIDYYIWMDHESGFHLTNIILHSANVILVYMLCLLLIKGQGTVPLNKGGEGVVPFFSAILFATHPINAEAVNFISARTDILSTFFILISFLLFLYYKMSVITHKLPAISYLILSVLSYLLAILSKEVALAFPLIIMAYEFFKKRIEKWRRIRSVFWILIIFMFPTMLYFYFRSIGLSEGDIGMSKFLVKIDATSSEMMFDFIASVGFYFKKLLYPFPLNLAIVEINKALYFFIGTIFLAFLLALGLTASKGLAVTSQNMANGENILPTVYSLLPTFCLLSILLSLLPSIPIALAPIAWTPYAERYLYLPSVFFCILFSFLLSSLVPRPSSLVIMIAIVIGFSIATYKRNILWLSNLTIWEDTVKKSPKFSKVRNEYGAALMMKGEVEKAKEQFLKAIELGHKSMPLFNLGYLAMKNNDYELAVDYFNKGLRIMPDATAYRKLGFIYEEKAVKYDNREYLLKAIEDYQKAYQLNRSDEFLALKLAGLYYRTERYEDARTILQGFIKNNPNSYIEKPAKKLLDKIFETDRLN